MRKRNYAYEYSHVEVYKGNNAMTFKKAEQVCKSSRTRLVRVADSDNFKELVKKLDE